MLEALRATVGDSMSVLHIERPVRRKLKKPVQSKRLDSGEPLDLSGVTHPSNAIFEGGEKTKKGAPRGTPSAISAVARSELSQSMFRLISASDCRDGLHHRANHRLDDSLHARDLVGDVESCLDFVKERLQERN
jgi:hypothetical protein